MHFFLSITNKNTLLLVHFFSWNLRLKWKIDVLNWMGDGSKQNAKPNQLDTSILVWLRFVLNLLFSLFICSIKARQPVVMNVIVGEKFELSKDYDTHIYAPISTNCISILTWFNVLWLYHGNSFAILIHKFMFRLHPFGMNIDLALVFSGAERCRNGLGRFVPNHWLITIYCFAKMDFA